MRVLKYTTSFVVLLFNSSLHAHYAVPSSLGIERQPSIAIRDSLPEGWSVSPHSTSAEYFKVNNVKHGGDYSLFCKREPTEKFGFGSLVYSVEARSYWGKRLKIGIWIKSYDVMKSFFTIRIYDKDSLVAMSTTISKPITETTDWTNYTITIDVPEESIQLDFHVLLHEYGELWLDDLNFETVEKSGSTDDFFAKTNKQGRLLPKVMARPVKKPANLGFEE